MNKELPLPLIESPRLPRRAVLKAIGGAAVGTFIATRENHDFLPHPLDVQPARADDDLQIDDFFPTDETPVPSEPAETPTPQPTQTPTPNAEPSDSDYDTEDFFPTDESSSSSEESEDRSHDDSNSEATPTPTEEVEPEETPTPSPTPTNERELPSLSEQLKAVSADREKMKELARVQREVAESLNTTGACLFGVQNAMDAVGLPVYDEDKDGNMLRYEDGTPKRPESAYRMIYLLKKDPRFAELLFYRPDTHKLPVGSILVYERDPQSPYDDVDGRSHGHISVIIGKDDGSVHVASDHVTTLEYDMVNMPNSEIYGFVPVQRGEETTLTESQDGLGFLPPEYYDSSDQYFTAIFNTFGMKFKNYQEHHYRWAWEKLWGVASSKFSRLVDGLTAIAVDGANSRQLDTHTVQVGKDASSPETDPEGRHYKALVTHEAGHALYNRYLEIIYPRIKEAFEKEGPVSRYGEIGYRDTLNSDEPDEVTKNYKLFHEDFADTIMYMLNPDYSTSAQNLIDYQENLLYAPGNPRPLHRKLAEDILFGNLILED